MKRIGRDKVSAAYNMNNKHFAMNNTLGRAKQTSENEKENCIRKS